MKIDEVKVGERYAAHDQPKETSRFGSPDLPREVEVLEIVQVEERVYGNAWIRADSPTTRKVRRVKVRVHGDAKDGYYKKQIARAAEGSEITIEARYLIGPWSKLAPGVAKEIELRAARERRLDELEARLEALLGKKAREHGTYPSVDTYSGSLRATLHVAGDNVEKLLALAEKGKAS